MVVAPHPLLTWAQELAGDLVREDPRARLSDELHPDVVSEILLARLERQDPVAHATAWLRAERSWRHHLARCSTLPDGRWHAPASAPAVAASTTPAPAAGPRRTSGAATAAVVRASPTASVGHPTTRCGGRRPGDGWRSGRSRSTSRSTAGAVRAGTARRTRCDLVSWLPTTQSRSSSEASRCRHGLACSVRAAMRARG
jgi:hypothetical protein